MAPVNVKKLTCDGNTHKCTANLVSSLLVLDGWFLRLLLTLFCRAGIWWWALGSTVERRPRTASEPCLRGNKSGKRTKYPCRWCKKDTKYAKCTIYCFVLGMRLVIFYNSFWWSFEASHSSISNLAMCDFSTRFSFHGHQNLVFCRFLWVTLRKSQKISRLSRYVQHTYVRGARTNPIRYKVRDSS